MHTAVVVVEFPATSLAVAVSVYARPAPVPERSARSLTVVPVTTMSVSVWPLPGCSGGSLLVPVTVGDPGAKPDRSSAAITVAT